MSATVCYSRDRTSKHIPYTVYFVLTQGLDPASRRNLWDVVKAARTGRGIILTTHSMEEAEVLCDRLGIFVDGRLVCVGAPKAIAARYGTYLVPDLPISKFQGISSFPSSRVWGISFVSTAGLVTPVAGCQDPCIAVHSAGRCKPCDVNPKS